jgi:hypothetical protein
MKIGRGLIIRGHLLGTCGADGGDPDRPAQERATQIPEGLAEDATQHRRPPRLRLQVYPVVLGAGDRLFGETQDKIPLRLVESRPFGGGVVSMIYAPAIADG